MTGDFDPLNVNPHFDHPEAFGLRTEETNHADLSHHFNITPFYDMRTCPSCGYCPTCGRHNAPVYYGPYWGIPTNPFYVSSGTTTAGAPVTFKAVTI